MGNPGNWNRGPLRGQGRLSPPGPWFSRKSGGAPAGLSPIFDVTFTSDANDAINSLSPTFTRASTAYGTSVSGSVTSLVPFTVNQPRVGSWNDGSETRNGVLLEESRENLALDTDQFPTPNWQYNNSSASSVSSTENSPDPSKKALELIPNSGSNTFSAENFQGRFAITSGVAYAASVYVKLGTLGTDWMAFRIIGPAGTSAAETFFNLSTGAVGNQGPDADTATIEAWGNGWYRVALTFTPTANGDSWVQLAPASANGNKTVTGNGSDPALYLFGFQYEAGDYASSYISSGSAATTRAADSGLIYTIPSADGPLTVSLSSYVDTSANRHFTTLTNAPAFSERIRFTASSDLYNVPINAGASSPPTIVSTGTNIITQSWAEYGIVTANSDHALLVNAITPFTQSTGDAPEGITQVAIGSDRFGTNIVNGWVGRFRVYNDRLTTEQIQGL